MQHATRPRANIPALIPQVYLHYDPYDQRTPRGLSSGTPLGRQRMDFLLLISDRQPVVIEADGKQHYAQGDQASAALHSEMVAEDRRLRLAGYEVYRFGGLRAHPEAEQRGDGSGLLRSARGTDEVALRAHPLTSVAIGRSGTRSVPGDRAVEWLRDIAARTVLLV